MNPIVLIITVLASIEGGWLCFDGCRALIVGDYVTPSSGEYAGQLGPWANLVAAVGIEPRSLLMKWIHVILGATKLALVVCFGLNLKWAHKAMIVIAVMGLWYLPFGTLLCLIQLGLLAFPTVRNRYEDNKT